MTLSVMKDGKELQFPITVKADGEKPAIKVCRDELLIERPLVMNQDGKNIMIFSVRNQSRKGVVKKLVCRFRCSALCEIQTGDQAGDTEVELVEKTVAVSFGKILPGKAYWHITQSSKGF